MASLQLANVFDKAKLFVSEASELIRQQFSRGFQTEVKSDSSFVTEVDIAVERLLEKRLRTAFPDFGIVGEEGATHNPGASQVWVLDPIDGTQSFVHGIPTFGCMLALLQEGEPAIGIIDHPALREQYAAAKGLGLTCNGKSVRIRDSGHSEIDQNEVLCICRRKLFELSDQGALFDNLFHKHGYYRMYYDCFGLTRAVAGQVGAAIEYNVKLWDIAPCKVMVEEAGGSYLDLGKRTLENGTEVYSAVFGKRSVTRQIQNWIQQAKRT